MTNVLKAKIERLEAVNAELLECLEGIQKVIESKEFESLFVLSHVHGIEYNGPRVETEKIRQAIEKATE